MTSRDHDMTSRDSYVLYLFIIWPLCQLVHLKKNAAYFYGLSDCIKKHHKYCQNIRIQGCSIPNHQPYTVIYDDNLFNPKPKFPLQSINFLSRNSSRLWILVAKIISSRSINFIAKKTYTPRMLTFLSLTKQRLLSDKKVNIRYYFGLRLLVRLYYAFLLHKKKIDYFEWLEIFGRSCVRAGRSSSPWNPD